MRSIDPASHVVLMVALVATTLAQQAANTIKPGTPKAPVAIKPKLTEPQKRGLALLGQAEAEAAALQPDMRAYIEWQASMGYQKFDLKKSNALLESAFTATSELSSSQAGNCWTQHDEECRVKHWLEENILQEMEKRSPDRALELSAGLEPDFRTAVETRLLRSYMEQKDLGNAKEMLDRMAGADGFPYAEAADLMATIPRSRSTERTAIFSQALNNYRQFNTMMWVDEGDFGTMLLRCWRDLPPEVALDAVDAILEKTKADGESNSQPASITTGHHGDIRFSSSYQLRVFQLLPILRELDAGRADSMLRDEASLQSLAQKYPNGMFSIDKNFGTTSQDGSTPEIFSMEPIEDEAFAGTQAEYARQYTYIEDTLKREPKDALAFALGLPETSADGRRHPRVAALMTVARGAAKKNPEVCRSALAEIRKLIDNEQPGQVTNILLQAVELYQQMGDTDNAKSTLKQADRVIEQLYKKDADIGDPNKVFKGNWPSTQLWGRCLHLSAKIAPEMQQTIMEDIPDPEIKSLLKIAIADGLLGTERPELTMGEMHKDGKRSYMMMR